MISCIDCGATLKSQTPHTRIIVNGRTEFEYAKRCKRCAGKQLPRGVLVDIKRELNTLIELYSTPRARTIVGEQYAENRLTEWIAALK